MGSASSFAFAGGITLYEVGTADVGLAAAGYSARAQDAATVLTNPAGMTRLEGKQALFAGQLLWANNRFSTGSGTSAALGTSGGGYAVGANGWFPGGGAFFTQRVSPEITLGFAATGNFGLGLEYDDDWVGRYYVQQTTLLGFSLLPSIAYKATDKLSLGASLNAMYGMYKNQVAINNVDPRLGDGQLKLDDKVWGWGVNVGLLYEVDAGTRLGLTWSSQVDLDFDAPAEWSNLAPGISTVLANRGLLDANIGIGIKVPQGVMGSVFAQVNDRWAILGNVGWQQWSKFGQVQLGVNDSTNPTSVAADLAFDDTWHVALGAQYRHSEPWLVTFGIAYDSGFQSSSNISPLLPTNAAWRFGAGAQQQLGRDAHWGFAAEYAYGGTLDTNLQSTLPVALGGRGNLVGSYENTGVIFLAVYYRRTF
jgi:long-chain fatty acid transport protein